MAAGGTSNGAFMAWALFTGWSLVAGSEHPRVGAEGCVVGRGWHVGSGYAAIAHNICQKNR
jgi:hypothetical protein